MDRKIISLFLMSAIIISGFFWRFNFLENNVVKASGALENLDELMARKTRLSSVTGYNLLENAANNYTWQPETLQYNDATTGNEVWRMTATPTSWDSAQDIGFSPWDANGNRMIFQTGRTTSAFTNYGTTMGTYFLANTDGSRLKPALNAAAQLATVDKYPMWSPIIPDVYYQGAANDGQSTSKNTLYQTNVTDTTLSHTAILTISPSVASWVHAKKGISSDGRKMYLFDENGGAYSATIYPTASLDTSSSGYAAQLNFDWFWGGAPSPSWNGYHDQYLTGGLNTVDGVWNILMPEWDNGPYWRARLSGTGINGAPVHTISETPPYSWGGQVEPVNTIDDYYEGAPPYQPSPWCRDGSTTPAGTYCAGDTIHDVPDRWGRYLIGEDWESTLGNGVTFLDMETHIQSPSVFRSGGASSAISTNLQNMGHSDWEAFSDWSVADGTTVLTDPVVGPTGIKHIVAQNYKVATSQYPVVYTHESYNTGQTPVNSTYVGPSQSPDGTKVSFTSTFLSAVDTNEEIFWAVAYYPYPPQIQSASQNGSNVKLTWDFNQGSNCSANSSTTPRTGPTPNFTNSRTYATRGWPNETLDCPPSPREIDKFRVWSSADDTNWTPLGTTTYNNCRAGSGNECGMWAESSWNFNASQPNGTTRYYAITSQEYSGLESRTLSNVWKVTTDSNGNITSQIQQSVYPSNPGGKSPFYVTSPDAPTAITSSYEQAPASAAGQYTINWNAPINNSLIRYYNIYAHDGSAPSIMQSDRIASIPATSNYAGDGKFTYIDLEGNTNGSTQYTVTSVDYQGNESGVSTQSDTTPPSAPSGFSVI